MKSNISGQVSRGHDLLHLAGKNLTPYKARAIKVVTLSSGLPFVLVLVIRGLFSPKVVSIAFSKAKTTTTAISIHMAQAERQAAPVNSWILVGPLLTLSTLLPQHTHKIISKEK